MPQTFTERPTTVRIRCRRTELGDDESLTAQTVHCPLKGVTVPFSACRRCGRIVEESSEAISCLSLRDAPVSSRGPATISEMMPRLVTCVDGDLPFGELVALMAERRLTAVPVVEDEGVLLGLVTRGRLAPPEHFGDHEVGLTAEDVMKTRVPTVSESAPLAEAIDALATEDVEALPVVAANDVVVGLLTSVEVLRWLRSHLPPL